MTPPRTRTSVSRKGQRVDRRKPDRRRNGRNRRCVNPETGNNGSYESDHDNTHILHEGNQPGVGAVGIGPSTIMAGAAPAIIPKIAVVSAKCELLMTAQQATGNDDQEAEPRNSGHSCRKE